MIEAVSGMSWEDFVQSRILAKVGMTTSNVRHSDATKAGNVATPHAPVDGKVRPIAPFDSDNTNPAGGINSNAEDMAKWLLVQLAEGQLADGTRAHQAGDRASAEHARHADPDRRRRRRSCASCVRTSTATASASALRDYRGHKLLTHTGGLPGYVSKVAMIPDARLGIAILTNQESTRGVRGDRRSHHGRLSRRADLDWIAAYQAIEKRAAPPRASPTQTAAASRATRRRSRRCRWSDTPGSYRDAWYGDMTITASGGGLAIRFDQHAAARRARSSTGSTTLRRALDRSRAARRRVRHLRAARRTAAIDTVKMRAVSPDTDFSYDFQDCRSRSDAIIPQSLIADPASPIMNPESLIGGFGIEDWGSRIQSGVIWCVAQYSSNVITGTRTGAPLSLSAFGASRRLRPVVSSPWKRSAVPAAGAGRRRLDRYAIRHPVQRHVGLEHRARGGIGLERDHPAAGCRPQRHLHHVEPDMRADVDAAVTRPDPRLQIRGHLGLVRRIPDPAAPRIDAQRRGAVDVPGQAAAGAQHLQKRGIRALRETLHDGSVAYEFTSTTMCFQRSW